MTEQIIQALLASGRSSAHQENHDSTNDDAYFCAEDALEASDLKIKVDGIGQLALPLSRDAISRLQAVAAPAQFGLREQTLLDKSVRDTHEISADKLQITYDEVVMADLLANACATMGLPPAARLVPHLHNLLIYGPGQFFKPHQDSEKLRGMVATLVIVLPSPHIGGVLRIAHLGDEYHFESENLDAHDLKCIVFYADCTHEIHKVRQGWRVSLTYNLVLDCGDGFLANDTDAKQANPTLSRALAAYFAPNSANPSGLPKLACFLDHRYSEHGLRWDLLKGLDHQHARTLCLAAEQLDLVPYLALAEIRQTWSALGDEDDPEPEDLIDSDTRLTYWVDLKSHKVNLRECHLRENEIGWLTELDEDDFDDSAYEGWTGNAGQTIDYWYRRAAIVLWPRRAEVAMQFLYNYNAALASLLALTKKPGNQAAVADTLANAGSYLHQFKWDDPFPNRVQALMQIALYVNDSAIARACLHPLTIPEIDEAAITTLAQLQNAYGSNWCLQLMALWQGNKAKLPSPGATAPKIELLVQQLLAANTAGCAARSTANHAAANAETTIALATFLLKAHLATRISNDALAMKDTPKERNKSTKARNSQLHGLMQACAALADAAVADDIVNHAINHPGLYCAPDLAEMILDMPPDSATLATFAKFRQHVAVALHQEIRKGARGKTDWSLDAETRCDCLYCKPVADFVRSVPEAQKIWGLAAQHRDHIMHHFGSLGLPLDFEVRRQGSPHKLVVTKNPRLHQEAQERYARVLALSELLGALRAEK